MPQAHQSSSFLSKNAAPPPHSLRSRSKLHTGGLEGLNRRLATAMAGPGEHVSADQDKQLFGDKGPFWTRSFVWQPEARACVQARFWWSVSVLRRLSPPRLLCRERALLYSTRAHAWDNEEGALIRRFPLRFSFLPWPHLSRWRLRWRSSEPTAWSQATPRRTVS